MSKYTTTHKLTDDGIFFVFVPKYVHFLWYYLYNRYKIKTRQLYLICKIRKFYCGSSVTGHVFSRDTTHHSSCYLPRKGHRVSWMKCLTIVITLFVVCLWCSILFMDRRPEHCHRDFALIVIVKTTSSLLYLAVRKTWGSLTCFGFICSVLNSLCILNGARDKS